MEIAKSAVKIVPKSSEVDYKKLNNKEELGKRREHALYLETYKK